MLRYIVTDNKYITEDAILITLKPKTKKDQLFFYPGQYSAIAFKKYGRPSPFRCFSMVSPPDNYDELQFSVRIGGNYTHNLANLKPGDKMLLHGPFGNFVVDPLLDKNIVLIAGGIGIAPFMSMIKDSVKSNIKTSMVLLYSCRSQDNIPFYSELLELEKMNPMFKVAFFITSGDVDKLKNARVLAGPISEKRLIELTKGNFNNFTYFICGPKGFMNGISRSLIDNKTNVNKIITEDFSTTSMSLIKTDKTSRIPKWTYSMTSLALIFAFAFIMIIDLKKAVPKLAQLDDSHSLSSKNTTVSNSSSATTSATNEGSSTTGSSTSVSGSSTGSALSGSSTSTPSSGSSSNLSHNSTTQTYQQPITSVS